MADLGDLSAVPDLGVVEGAAGDEDERLQRAMWELRCPHLLAMYDALVADREALLELIKELEVKNEMLHNLLLGGGAAARSGGDS